MKAAHFLIFPFELMVKVTWITQNLKSVSLRAKCQGSRAHCSVTKDHGSAQFFFRIPSEHFCERQNISSFSTLHSIPSYLCFRLFNYPRNFRKVVVMVDEVQSHQQPNNVRREKVSKSIRSIASSHQSPV